MAGDTSHIVQSLFANMAIAAAKGVAAFFTGSGAMLAEAIHSLADCSNQGLLLMGVKAARKPPDETHPMGYGRNLYFWSFMVAMLLFSVGGAFSVYEGIHKIRHPEPINHVGIGLGVLFFSLLIEGWATISNIKELNKRRKAMPFFTFLRTTKDSDLVVVFGENAAATAGLVFAMIALTLGWVLDQPVWDGVGSLVVGIVLLLVAVFLAVEVKGLLVGEAADPIYGTAVKEVARRHAGILDVFRQITIQQGPGEVMIAAKVSLAPGLSAAEAVATINAFENDLQTTHPEVKWCFVEPDVPQADGT